MPLSRDRTARRTRDGVDERKCTHCSTWLPEDGTNFRKHAGHPKDLSYECLWPECKTLRSARRRKPDGAGPLPAEPPEPELVPNDIGEIADLLCDTKHEFMARPTVNGPFPLAAADGPGIYAWYSDLTLPLPLAYRDGPWKLGDRYLLYIGIVEVRPLRNRLNRHCRGYAGQSPVQKGLVALLADGTTLSLDESGLLRCRPDDQRLKAWMCEHTHFAWQKLSLPALYEKALIHRLQPLLNLEYNEHHRFHERLAALLALVGG